MEREASRPSSGTAVPPSPPQSNNATGVCRKPGRRGFSYFSAHSSRVRAMRRRKAASCSWSSVMRAPGIWLICAFAFCLPAYHPSRERGNRPFARRKTHKTFPVENVKSSKPSKNGLFLHFSLYSGGAIPYDALGNAGLVAGFGRFCPLFGRHRVKSDGITHKVLRENPF
jgi:hypothetical protein